MIAALLALVALVAGCGSNDEQNSYVDDVNAIQNQLVADVTDATSGTAPNGPDAAASVAGDLQQVFADTADELDAVAPPSEVADLHQQLVDTVRKVADQISEAEKAFTNGNARQASQAAVVLESATTQAQTDLNTIINEINSGLGSSARGPHAGRSGGGATGSGCARGPRRPGRRTSTGIW